MQVSQRSFSPILRPLSRPPQDPQGPPPEKFDKAVLGGQIAGGLGLGLGLGYVGLEHGMRVGLTNGMHALGGHPAAQLFSLFVVGLPQAILGASIGGALGAATGVGAGAYLGGKIGEHFSKG